jgi:hypothetical protein
MQRVCAAGLLDLNGFHGDVPASLWQKGIGTMSQPNFMTADSRCTGLK